MRRIFPIVLSILAGCATVGESRPHAVAVADLRNATGDPVGTAVISEVLGQISVTVTAARLSPGLHGMHLHSAGRCDAPDFTSAGPHLNPTGHQHGGDNPAGPHLGDLPNLQIAEGGIGGATALLRGQKNEIESVLFDVDGTAIVIHATTDDNRTDPSGNSGPRIACGVFERP